MINIFSKLKEIIYNFFKKPKQLKLEEKNKINDLSAEQIEENKFNDNLQKEIKDNNNKLSIIEIVNENTEVLELLTTERLIQLDKMYDEKISEARRELEELKMKINNMQ